MKKLMVLLVLAAGLMMGLSVSTSVASDPVPTLTPPTLVPTQDAGISDALLSESTISRVQRDGKVRVGLLYNAPPFGELNVRGEVTGYDADLARSMAEAWGVKVEPVQVTRQTGLVMLKNGTVDMLMGAQVHRRELDSEVEFSLTYYPGSVSILIRQDDSATKLADMANRKIGVVMGTSAEGTAAAWQARTNITLTLQRYLTLDQAFVALVNKEIDGVLESRIDLLHILRQPDMGKILDEPVAPEPYAIAVRRQDVNWLNLVNRTLQYLVKKGRMAEIQKAYFPGANYPPDLIPLWAGLSDDAPKPSQFGTDVPYPAQYVVPRIQQARIVRVAGVNDVPADAPESDKRLDTLNRAMVEAMAKRWGMTVQYIPNSAANALDLVAGGQADLAVGVSLDWAAADKVDLTLPYLLHGQRLLVKADSDAETFTEIRGQWVGVFASEPGVSDTVNKLADSVGASVRIFTINRDQDAAFSMLSESNADVIFGDSLKLIPLLEANAGQLKLSKRKNAPDPWYSRSYLTFAVPRNDLVFRLLVDYTLQEMARDGSWQALLAPVILSEDIPNMDIWPGSSDYLGFKLGT